MADNPPLTDDQVYALLQDCRNLLDGRTVATELGLNVITVMLKQVDTMQMAMVMMRDQADATETPE